ncbi:MAG TPA: class I SAM-dependent methyltransferase [Pirellulales bacterium]|nr:class I SAM-dependent methyltransferase [Pirellulales bacterium]
MGLQRYFPKYDDYGAYHWEECDRSARRFNPPLVARYAAVVRRVSSGQRVLDVGCGDGYLMSLLSPLAESVTGIDPEPAAIALANDKLKDYHNCSVNVGSCYDLEFPDNSFGSVVMADMIEHVDDDDLCVQEASRVLSPEGTVIVTTPRRRQDRPIGRDHVREYTADELAQLMRRWFAEIQIVGLWPLNWSKLYRTKLGWRAIKILARHCGNPFDREGTDTDQFAMLLAVGRQPRKQTVG